jgi:hypothetical protein
MPRTAQTTPAAVVVAAPTAPTALVDPSQPANAAVNRPRTGYDVRSNIAQGDYKTALKSPEHPMTTSRKKPAPLGFKHTSADAQRYAADLAVYEAAMESYSAAQLVIRADEAACLAKFWEDAAAELGYDRADPFAQTIEARARDNGNSLYEVFDQLEELVNSFWEPYKKVRDERDRLLVLLASRPSENP